MGNWVAARFIEALRAHKPTGDIPPLEGLDDLDRPYERHEIHETPEGLRTVTYTEVVPTNQEGR